MADPFLEPRRFRTNPIELAIFAAVGLIFVKSALALFYNGREGQAEMKALTAMNSNPLSEGRAPAASLGERFLNLEYRCSPVAERGTSAARVRLNGTLCNHGRETSLAKAEIVNQANKASATVFSDVTAGRFSTDYIPLTSGKNTIHVQFSYADGRVIADDINVIRN